MNNQFCGGCLHRIPKAHQSRMERLNGDLYCGDCLHRLRAVKRIMADVAAYGKRPPPVKEWYS